MNLYLISQVVNQDYDTFDAAVVCAESEQDARLIHPEGPDGWESMWAPVDKVEVKFLGSADPSVEAGVVCASFNAG
jgi:hypothetical protein